MTSEGPQSFGENWAQLNRGSNGKDIRSIISAVEQAVQVPVLRRGLQIYGALTLEYLERQSPQNVDPVPLSHVLPFVELLRELVVQGEPKAAERTAQGISHILSHAYGDSSVEPKGGSTTQPINGVHLEPPQPLSVKSEQANVGSGMLGQTESLCGVEAGVEPIGSGPHAKSMEGIEQVPVVLTDVVDAGTFSPAALKLASAGFGPQLDIWQQHMQHQQQVLALAAPEGVSQVTQTVPLNDLSNRTAARFAKKRRRRQENLLREQSLQQLVEEAQNGNDEAGWLNILESIRLLPTNNGGPTIDRIRRALDLLKGNETMKDVREQLEDSISLRVYKSNSAGATKRMALGALELARQRMAADKAAKETGTSEGPTNQEATATKTEGS